MTLIDRDRHICLLVRNFSQLTSLQIFRALFAPSTTRTTCDRALLRLVKSGHLARIERRLVGGSHGGSGLYVYALGPEGYKLYRPGVRYVPTRTIAPHTWAIVETYLTLHELEQADKLKVVGYSTEPDCWTRVDGIELQPDLYAELQRPGGQAVPFFFEVDMGSEKKRQFLDKLVAYVRASERADDSEWPIFPLVLIVAVDDARRDEIRWWMEAGKAEYQRLFRLTTIDDLKGALGG